MSACILQILDLTLHVPKAELSTGNAATPIFQPNRAINGLQSPFLQHIFFTSQKPSAWMLQGAEHCSSAEDNSAVRQHLEKFFCPNLKKKKKESTNLHYHVL